jgi:hypothetical protein
MTSDLSGGGGFVGFPEILDAVIMRSRRPFYSGFSADNSKAFTEKTDIEHSSLGIVCN